LIPPTLRFELAKAGGDGGELPFKISDLGRPITASASVSVSVSVTSAASGSAPDRAIIVTVVRSQCAGFALSGAIGGDALGYGFCGS
jgi:hypothetical protein